jgi:hypothetical protein
MFYDYKNESLEKVNRLPSFFCTEILKKKDILTENYICLKIPKFQQSLPAHSRRGIFPIRINTGRYRGEALEVS